MKQHVLVAALALFCANLVAGSCPAGSVKGLSNDQCYVFNKDPLSWYDAEAKCQELGGHLPSISSGFQNVFLSNASRNSISQEFWTGGKLIQRNPQKNWAWSDGSPWTYTSWANGQPGSTPASCLLLVAVNSLARNWFTEDCNYVRPYVCEVPSAKLQCPQGWFSIDSSTLCYKLVSGEKNWRTWKNALDACRNEKGDLASIASSQMNHELRMEVLKVSDDIQFWIGANRVYWSDFMWSDESPFIYAKWGVSQPQGTDGNLAVYMDQSGSWSSVPSEASARSFLCEKAITQ
ncbi:C-type mannose receptor 2 [Aphelenchoides avenae]|nr:C-type mannose receptor 2 [Aphelenchus avenae]